MKSHLGNLDIAIYIKLIPTSKSNTDHETPPKGFWIMVYQMQRDTK
jgi:hypothetical protein